jgi:ERF superfamily protein
MTVQVQASEDVGRRLSELSRDSATHSDIERRQLASALPVTGIAQITKAIATVMQEIDTVAKRGENTFHRYQYARMEDILQRLTPLLGKQGLVIFQDEIGRSMFDNDGVIGVTYEFAVAHESGEIWPQRLRQTGVSRCRDSKGGWDDKAFAKCHTAARKYFLLSLFQIPTGDEADADRGDDVAGEPEKPKAVRAETGAKEWATSFLALVRQAPTAPALDQLLARNQNKLVRLTTVAPGQRQTVDDAVNRRRAELTPSPKSLPPLVRERTSRPAPQV